VDVARGTLSGMSILAFPVRSSESQNELAQVGWAAAYSAYFLVHLSERNPSVAAISSCQWRRPIVPSLASSGCMVGKQEVVLDAVFARLLRTLAFGEHNLWNDAGGIDSNPGNRRREMIVEISVDLMATQLVSLAYY
jgi:hypothetical protein